MGVEDRGGASSMYLVFVGPPDMVCDGVDGVNRAKAGKAAAEQKKSGGGKGFILLFVLLLLCGVAGFFGHKYHTLRKKVEGGSIYSDDQFKGYAGASEGAEGTANPTAAD